jgi:hypothetical protein
MASAASELDEQIERLRKGDTLAENEVKALCEKVSGAQWSLSYGIISWFAKPILQRPHGETLRQRNGFPWIA